MHNENLSIGIKLSVKEENGKNLDCFVSFDCYDSSRMY
jgi:hypothetical protein